LLRGANQTCRFSSSTVGRHLFLGERARENKMFTCSDFLATGEETAVKRTVGWQDELTAVKERAKPNQDGVPADRLTRPFLMVFSSVSSLFFIYFFDRVTVNLFCFATEQKRLFSYSFCFDRARKKKDRVVDLVTRWLQATVIISKHVTGSLWICWFLNSIYLPIDKVFTDWFRLLLAFPVIDLCWWFVSRWRADPSRPAESHWSSSTRRRTHHFRDWCRWIPGLRSLSWPWY